MSTIESNEEATGHFLPEDGWLRLKQLRGYVTFLTNLARPHRPDGDKAWTAETRVGELAIGLALLEEQIGQVLDDLSRPAGRGERAAAPEVDADTDDEDALVADMAVPGTAVPAKDESARRYVAGVTLDQIDGMTRSLESLRALANVVACADHAELASTTLAIMGDALYRDVGEIRDIVDDIDTSQRLEPPSAPRPGVGEERAVYLSWPSHPYTDGAYVAPPHPTRQ